MGRHILQPGDDSAPFHIVAERRALVEFLTWHSYHRPTGTMGEIVDRYLEERDAAIRALPKSR